MERGLVIIPDNLTNDQIESVMDELDLLSKTNSDVIKDHTFVYEERGELRITVLKHEEITKDCERLNMEPYDVIMNLMRVRYEK